MHRLPSYPSRSSAPARSAWPPPPTSPTAAWTSSSWRPATASAASVADWAHVRLFSPWRYNTDPAARALLEADRLDRARPGRAAHRRRAHRRLPAPRWPRTRRSPPHLRFGAQVTAIARQGFDQVRTAGREHAPFLVRLADGDRTARLGRHRRLRHLAHAQPAGRQRPRRARRDRRQRRRPGLRRHARRRSARLRDQLRRHRPSRSSAPATPPTDTLLALAELADAEHRHRGHLGCSARPTRPAPTAAATPTRCPPAARSAPGSGRLVDAGRVTVHTGFFVHELTDATAVVSADGRKVDADVIVNATGARPDHASPPSCAWTSTRSSAPPARWPR